MALTVQTGLQAGQIASAIVNLQNIIAELQQALANGETITSMTAGMSAGGALTASAPLNTADTTTIFNAIIGVCQSNISALTDQLAALG